MQAQLARDDDVAARVQRAYSRDEGVAAAAHERSAPNGAVVASIQPLRAADDAFGAARRG